MGEADEAVRCYKDVLKVAVDAGDQTAEALACNCIGAACAREKRKPSPPPLPHLHYCATDSGALQNKTLALRRSRASALVLPRHPPLGKALSRTLFLKPPPPVSPH
eukprot:scaffold14621_cov55-Isochrysis_galbana.AAC.2